MKTEEDQTYKPMKAPMTDHEFRNYLDSDGHMVKPEEFRLSIYQGGVEHSLRRVVWRHLLNIFPEELSGRERFDYMKKKENEYFQLREKWVDLFNSGHASEEAKHVASLVRKDVMRTDRTHKHYSGTDDNKNLKSLFHLLVTYALTHPEISYCQGMSDLASPLLVVQKEEAQAYLCFCALMKRLRSNFLFDGKAITTKLQHLTDLVNFYDPVFGNYLRTHGAEDLFFCYRWLLLEMKREFPFDDSMYMLEVMWSTIPMDPPEGGLPLTDPEYIPSLMSMSPHSPSFSVKQTLYAHLLARRRHPVKDTSCPKSPETEQNMPTKTSVNEQNMPDDTESRTVEQSTCCDSESVIPEQNKSCFNSEGSEQGNLCPEIHVTEQKPTSPFCAIDCNLKKENDKMERDMNLNITNIAVALKGTSLENGNERQVPEEGLKNENSNKTKTNKHHSRKRQEMERFPSLISGSLDSSISSSDDFLDAETELISSTEKEKLNQSSAPMEMSEIASDLKYSSENHTQHNQDIESEDEHHSQFYLSLEEHDISTLNEMERTKKERIPEIKGSFFSGMKKILSSPKKKPGGGQQVTTTTTVPGKLIDKKTDTSPNKENTAENINLTKETNGKNLKNKGKERNFKKLFIGNNGSSHKNHENNQKVKQSDSDNGNSHSEEDTLFDQVKAKNIKQTDKSDSDSGNGSLTRSQNFTESTRKPPVVQGRMVISDHTDLRSVTEKVDNTLGTKDKKGTKEEKNISSDVEFCENHFDLLNNEGEKDDGIADCTEADDEQEVKLISFKQLPPPEEFGFGNPFLMFLCLTVLIQHRDFIMKNGMEYDELAMYFDKMVRKHNVNKVLHQTRILYSDYIRMQQKLRAEKLEEEQLHV